MRIYIQQYGKERTGTNYLKALLARNFTDFVLFDNRLGSKHEHFRTVSDWMQERQIIDRSSFEHLLNHDEYWRQRNRPTSDPFEWVHQPITYEELLALRDQPETLHYLVQIKNPFAFAVSINRWQESGSSDFDQPPSINSLNLPATLEQCAQFNRVYSSYWPLVETGKAILIRYEDLLSDASAILSVIQQRFALPRKNAYYEQICETVVPFIGVSGSRFYRSYYLDQDYLGALSASEQIEIRKALDWNLMQRYGYISTCEVL